jgi:internalin A
MANLTPEKAYEEAEKRIEEVRREGGGALALGHLGLVEIPAGIWTLTGLHSISLVRNRLSSIPDAIGYLTQLHTLLAYDNQLTSIPHTIGNCTGLTLLSLSGNQLRSIPDSIGNLTKLLELSLQNNQLSSIPESVGNLVALLKLYLGRNRLSSLPLGIRNLRNLERLFLDDNPLLGLPPEILGPTSQEVVNEKKQSALPAAILDYYFEARSNGRQLNEVKLILVGRGAVGKTSLVRRLVANTFDPDEPQTPGIRIIPWRHPLPGYGEVQLNVWDFGGQEIMHGTHQFFLTERSLYLVVLAGRAGKEQEEAEYWLRFVRQFGNAAPTVVILNKHRQQPFDLNRKALREKFPFVVEFVETDCHGCMDVAQPPTPNGFGIDRLQGVIEERLSGWEALRYWFPGRWFAIKDAVSGMEDDFISFERFRDICGTNGEADTTRQEHLAKYLNQLGIALNFKDDPRLRDTHVLKPNWLTNGVYTLLNHKPLADNKGVFRFADLKDILPADKYPPNMHPFLLDLMRKFDLCFRLEAKEEAKAPTREDYLPDDRFLLPERLPVNEPDLGDRFRPEKCLGFEYRYPAWPEGLVPRFIVRTYVLSEGKERWRSGVVIEFEGCEALVKGDETDRTVTIRIAGPAEARRNALAVVRTYFEDLHRGMGVDPDEFVSHPTKPGLSISYKELTGFEQNNVPSFPRFWNGEVVTVTVAEMLNIADPPEIRQPTPTAERPTEEPVRVFVSYAHRDERDMKRLEAHLKLAERQRLISVWYDRLLKPGDEWDPRILEELDRAAIIVMLVSADFFASGYIFDKELPRALERHKAKQAVAIAVILNDCEWSKTEVAQFQLLPKDGKSVKKWRPQDTAWTTVAVAVRQTAEAMRKKKPR